MNQQDLCYPQPWAIKVLVKMIRSHQGLLSIARQMPPHTPMNLKEADEAIEGMSRLLGDLRLGELKLERWKAETVLWCLDCGNNWEGNGDDTCPECGGESSDA